jgi:hypothetical protein
VPFNVLISSDRAQIDIIDESIRKENSYKSFVAPDKLAECLRILVDKPWDKIADDLNDTAAISKAKLRSVVDLRNRIVHEADVNPAYGRIELWPIYCEDVENSIAFLSSAFRNFHAARDYVAVQKMSSAAMNSRARSIDKTARPRGPPAIHRSFQSDQ